MQRVGMVSAVVLLMPRQRFAGEKSAVLLPFEFRMDSLIKT